MSRPGFDSLLEGDGRVLGTWTQFTDPQMIDLLGLAGYRFTIIDCEHGAFGIETAAALVRACEAASVVPLVRVPRGEHGLAARLLDAGAAGIVAPGVESSQEANAWVQALRFAPGGQRSACPIVRAAGHSLLDWEDTLREQARTGLVVLVETAAGVEACEAIVATPGIDGLMVGPFDLAASMGRPGDVQAADVQACVMRVVAAACAAGVPPWLPVFAPDPAELGLHVTAWAARGVRHFPIGADKIMVAAGLREFVGAASVP